MNEPTKLDETRIKTLCKSGQGRLTCSFLAMAAPHGMCCAKGTAFESAIRSRRPTMKAQGDNCSGPPDFTPNAKPMAANLELWQAVAARADLIGGDMETEEGGTFYRGPLKEIKILDGEYVLFTMEWMAKRDGDSHEWTSHGITNLATEIENTKPSLDGNGPVRFTIPYLGPVTLFPKGKNNLDPASVAGLTLKQ